MDTFIATLLRLLSFFSAKQLTAEEVLACVPNDWICTMHGKSSLRKILEEKYLLDEGELGDGEFYHLLKTLEARLLIELEVRQWPNPHDGNFYPHQQCRKAREVKPDLPQSGMKVRL